MSARANYSIIKWLSAHYPSKSHWNHPLQNISKCIIFTHLSITSKLSVAQEFAQYLQYNYFWRIHSDYLLAVIFFENVWNYFWTPNLANVFPKCKINNHISTTHDLTFSYYWIQGICGSPTTTLTASFGPILRYTTIALSERTVFSPTFADIHLNVST